MWWGRIAEYLNFTKAERRGVIILLLIISCLWIIPLFFSSSEVGISKSEWEILERHADTASRSRSSSHQFDENLPPNFRRPGLRKDGNKTIIRDPFIFDPNSATDEDWRKLGLSERDLRTIRNYVSKGGRFRKPEDLRRIYGFPDDAYLKLQPYIRIREDPRSHFQPTFFQRQNGSEVAWHKSNRSGKTLMVRINSADSTQWESLPGIGPGYARRILNYRKKLGGFHQVGQVGETFGLPDSSFQRILPYLVLDSLAAPLPILINTATAEELRLHPYVSFQLARVLVAYREQHGPFLKAEDIRRIDIITPELFMKLSPYLKIN